MVYRRQTTNKQQVKSRLKQGDEIVVIAGKDKGKQGKILNVLRKGGQLKLLVEGINMIKKHVKPNPNAGQQGGIISKEAYLEASNVKIYNSATGKGDRVGYRILDDGRKVRCFKSTNELIESN